VDGFGTARLSPICSSSESSYVLRLSMTDLARGELFPLAVANESRRTYNTFLSLSPYGGLIDLVSLQKVRKDFLFYLLRFGFPGMDPRPIGSQR